MSVARSHLPAAPTPHPCADHRCTSIHETHPARASCATEPHGAGRSRPLPRGQGRRPGGRRPLRAAGHRTLRTPPFHVKHRDGLGPAVPSRRDLSPITRSRSHATRHRRCRSGVAASGAGHGCVGFTWNKLGLGPGGPPDATIAPRTGTRVDRGPGSPPRRMPGSSPGRTPGHLRLRGGPVPRTSASKSVLRRAAPSHVSSSATTRHPQDRPHGAARTTHLAGWPGRHGRVC